MFTGIHHVAIICSDFKHSKRFYTDVMGFQVVQEFWRADRQSWKCDLRLNLIQLELFSFPSPPARLSRPEACGLRHLAFSVVALPPVIEKLQSCGVSVEPIRIDEHTGRRFTFIADPDGLPLEIYEV